MRSNIHLEILEVFLQAMVKLWCIVLTSLFFLLYIDIDLCENSVLKHIGHHPNLTFEHLNTLMGSLPGKKVGKEDIERTMKLCQPTEQVLKLLNLWRIKNGDQDTIKGLMYGLKHLKTYHFPKRAIQSLKKVIKFLHRFTMYRLYQKLFLEMIGNQVKSVKVRCVWFKIFFILHWLFFPNYCQQ